LSEAVLDRADFAGAKFGGVNLSGASLLKARNLTQAQIDEALGDPLTVLPPHITRPEGWGGSGFQVVSGLQKRNGDSSSNGHVAPNRGDSVSWLVGGPRRAELKTPLPQAAPERR
jgi:hypothetical protein